jgi:N-acetyl-anhydromuramyl-L-alanine amidase AmpD
LRRDSELVEDIAARYHIPIDPDHVFGHYRVNQKVDSGPALNLFWSRAGYPPKPPIFGTPAP